MNQYKPCENCVEDRAAGRLAEAVECHHCGGKGIIRTRESWVCNGCGGCLCPEDEMNNECPHGLVEVKVEGGYSSPHLSDTTTYAFSLCEACLRKLFGTFKIPPKVGEYFLGGSGGGAEDTEPYAEELAARTRAVERNKAAHELHEKYVQEQRCTERPRKEDGSLEEMCGDSAVMTSRSGEWVYPRCHKHARDCYALKHVIVSKDGHELTFEQRSKIGNRYIKAFGDRMPIQPSDEHEAAIFITTLFTLVMNPKTWEYASRELERITHVTPQPAVQWEGPRVPLAFPPAIDGASIANRWLHYGREQGYMNAVAHALLGYDVASLWKPDHEPAEG